MSNVSFFTWPGKAVAPVTLGNGDYEPENFLGSAPVFATKPTYVDAKGNNWPNQAPVNGIGSPISGESVISLNTSKTYTTNVEFRYAGTWKPETLMNGVRGVYFETKTNQGEGNPRVTSAAMIYVNKNSDGFVFEPLQFDQENYVLSNFSIEPLGQTDGEWHEHRMVLADASVSTDTNRRWYGIVLKLDVTGFTGSAQNQAVTVRRLKPILDLGQDPSDLTQGQSRVVWQSF